MYPRKIPAWIHFIFFLVLLPWHSAAGSLESSVIADGSGRITFGLLGRSQGFSWAWNYKYDPEGPDTFLPGMVGPFCCSGHLGDAGLGSEIRNPGCDSLSRIDERTLYTPDLRSTSFSRFGISISAPGDRFGLVLENRNGQDCLLIRGGFSFSDKWDLEGLCQAALTETGPSDNSWYPEDDTYPGGLLISQGFRLRFMEGRHKIGVTTLGSAGGRIRPGMLMALASSWSKGPWRYRWRLVVSSQDYRTADAEKLRFPSGISLDFNYKPNRGLQVSFDLESGIQGYRVGELSPVIISALSLGWKYDGWLARVESNWNDSRTVPDNAGFELSWSGARASFCVKGSCIPDESWRLGAETEFPAGAGFALKLGTGVTVPDGSRDFPDSILWHCRLRFAWTFEISRVVLDYSMNDLPRDWVEGPSGAGDLELSLRYIHSVSD